MASQSVIEFKSRRRNMRMKSASYVRMLTGDERENYCFKIKNWSLAGICLEVMPDIDVPPMFRLQKISADEAAPSFMCKRIWREGDEVGISFVR